MINKQRPFRFICHLRINGDTPFVQEADETLDQVSSVSGLFVFNYGILCNYHIIESQNQETVVCSRSLTRLLSLCEPHFFWVNLQ